MTDIELKIGQQSSIPNTEKQQKFDSLTPIQIWAYGVGHFLNDLTAACWFNYLLFFLTTVVKTSAAPLALLVGQICDGIATPLVGYLSDRSTSSLGQRTPWYIFGLVTILICFAPIFSSYHHPQVHWEYLYYSVFPGLFNIGWACLQISHMSMAPSLTCSRKRRDQLNNRRNSFSFLANLVMLVTGLAVFALMNDKQKEYRIISYFAVILGLATSLFFLYHIKETQLVTACKEKKDKFKQKITQPTQSKQIDQILQNFQSVDSERTLKKSVSLSTNDDKTVLEDVVLLEQKQKSINLNHWLKKPNFYLFGICYMCVRLNSNIFGTFLPFYLIYILKLSATNHDNNSIPFSVALVPLLIYFSSSLISSQLSFLYSNLGRRKTLQLGTLLSIFSLGSLYFLDQQNRDLIYFSAVAIGASQSMILATGINLISDVIGNKSESGAIVFGIYSFLDKISAGIIIFLLANLTCFSQSPDLILPSESFIIKVTVIFIPMTAAILAALVLCIVNVQQYINQQNGLSDSKMQKKQFVNSVTLN